MLRHKISRKRPSVCFWVRCISSSWHGSSSGCLRHPDCYSLPAVSIFPTRSSHAIILVWTAACVCSFFLVPIKIWYFNLAKTLSRTHHTHRVFSLLLRFNYCHCWKELSPYLAPSSWNTQLLMTVPYLMGQRAQVKERHLLFSPASLFLWFSILLHYSSSSCLSEGFRCHHRLTFSWHTSSPALGPASSPPFLTLVQPSFLFPLSLS